MLGRMTAATAALSLPRVKSPVVSKPSLPGNLPQLRPFGFQPKFKFATSVDKVQSQASTQAAVFVRPDVPPMDSEQSPKQPMTASAGFQPRTHGRSALEQVPPALAVAAVLLVAVAVLACLPLYHASPCISRPLRMAGLSLVSSAWGQPIRSRHFSLCSWGQNES